MSDERERMIEFLAKYEIELDVGFLTLGQRSAGKLADALLAAGFGDVAATLREVIPRIERVLSPKNYEPINRNVEMVQQACCDAAVDILRALLDRALAAEPAQEARDG